MQLTRSHNMLSHQVILDMWDIAASLEPSLEPQVLRFAAMITNATLEDAAQKFEAGSAPHAPGTWLARCMRDMKQEDE